LGEAMAEDGLLHTAELLKTALPYVDIKSRLTLELLIKLYELNICIRNFTTNDISACGFENEKADMEALLNSIKPKCNMNELAFVDKMLNIFQAKRMFEMYNTYMEAMNSMEGFEGFGGGGSDGDSTSGFMNTFKDFDFTSVFGDDFDAESFLQSYKSTSSDNSDFQNYSNNTEDADDINISSDNDLVNETKYSNDMFESLKSMIPSDQMETFENLRMLFDTESYDDSNKPNE
jgi:hypothetical protein